ncbi:putative membrane protein [Rhodococcus opacus]|uniref:Putative membrane protein n=1 Tax=Rhodococcus opacus TaxID=37919 RepID=A0A1B1K6V6_RHOOP|nr:putative membrane protein [Rhodococcus opacus]
MLNVALLVVLLVASLWGGAALHSLADRRAER